MEPKPQSTSLPQEAAALVAAGPQRALATCIALEFRVRSASWLEPAEGWAAGLAPLAQELARHADAIGRRLAVLGLSTPPCVADLDRMSAVRGAWTPEDWRRRRSVLAADLIRVSEDCHTLIAILRNAGEEASLCLLANLLLRCEEASWALRRDDPP